MTQITNDDLHKAWRNWHRAEGGHYGAFLAFVEQDTHPMSWDTKGNIHHVHPDAARRLKLLCGPHHRTIIKAYYAKQHPVT
jgi:hypothetical protein